MNTKEELIRADIERTQRLDRVRWLHKQQCYNLLEIPFLLDEIDRRDAALKKACEWHDNTCPINELSLTGLYPEWCQFTADADGEPSGCRHWQGSYNCWLEYYTGRMDEMK